MISGNDSWGINFTTGSPSDNNNVIQGNLIGTDKTGTIALGNAGGVRLYSTQFNIVGGTASSAMNVISGNDGSGLVLGWSTSDNLIQGNHIGTDLLGVSGIPNTSSGIATANVISDNIIGGTAPGAGNVISANLGHGVDFYGTSGVYDHLNKVLGNFIGTDRTGTVALGNSLTGVLIEYTDVTSVGNWIPGGGNIIANNGEDGVRIGTPSGGGGIGNSVVGNAIYGNGGLGIDLGADGVLANDNGDADTGTNNLVNYPILVDAASSGGWTLVSAALNSLSDTTFHLDLYSNASADTSGYGEGKTYLGSTQVATDGTGNWAGSVWLPAVPAGHVITATTTDPAGSTSEFSLATIVNIRDFGFLTQVAGTLVLPRIPDLDQTCFPIS